MENKESLKILKNAYVEKFPQLENIDENELYICLDYLRNLYKTYKGIPEISNRNNKPLCLYCKLNPCIKSHSISENVLKTIASNEFDLFKFNNKWFYFTVMIGILNKYKYYESMDDSESILQHIKTSYASGFDGFCKDCDNKLFDSLDNGIHNGVDKMMWELLYRTVAYKIRDLEKYKEMQMGILDFANKNPSFYNIWNTWWCGTIIQTLYKDKKTVEGYINGSNIYIEKLYIELEEIKKYENDMNLFKKKYFYKYSKKKSKINYLGVNYMQYYPNGINPNIIEKLKDNLLVAQIGIKKNDKTYDYYNILITKKQAKENLKEIHKELKYKGIINYFLIENEIDHSNTFFKRLSNENNLQSTKKEKIKLGKKLNKTDYKKI